MYVGAPMPAAYGASEPFDRTALHWARLCLRHTSHQSRSTERLYFGRGYRVAIRRALTAVVTLRSPAADFKRPFGALAVAPMPAAYGASEPFDRAARLWARLSRCDTPRVGRRGLRFAHPRLISSAPSGRWRLRRDAARLILRALTTAYCLLPQNPLKTLDFVH